MNPRDALRDRQVRKTGLLHDPICSLWRGAAPRTGIEPVSLHRQCNCDPVASRGILFSSAPGRSRTCIFGFAIRRLDPLDDGGNFRIDYRTRSLRLSCFARAIDSDDLRVVLLHVRALFLLRAQFPFGVARPSLSWSHNLHYNPKTSEPPKDGVTYGDRTRLHAFTAHHHHQMTNATTRLNNGRVEMLVFLVAKSGFEPPFRLGRPTSHQGTSLRVSTSSWPLSNSTGTRESSLRTEQWACPKVQASESRCWDWLQRPVRTALSAPNADAPPRSIFACKHRCLNALEPGLGVEPS